MHYIGVNSFLSPLLLLMLSRRKQDNARVSLSNFKHKSMNKDEMQKVADEMAANTIFCTKEVLTSEEAARYMGISRSYLYKLTMRGEIPHFKPMGKMCYFNRKELEE